MPKFFFIFFLFLNLQAESIPIVAVTHTLSGGRLGDNLISYVHAKWISYKYHIPMLYKPFPLSDLFVFDNVDMEWTDQFADLFLIKSLFSVNHQIDAFIREKASMDSVLYIIPYFPESLWERRRDSARKDPDYFPYFPIDWEDQDFRKLLKKLIAPKTPIETMELPTDKLTVAVHIRRGGTYDGDQACFGYPLKFPPDEFFIDQLRNLYNLLGQQPLYVYLFTDDENPKLIQMKYCEALADLNIDIRTREKNNRWDLNVLEDFFALTQFDCAIHGESNFAVAAGLLSDYKVEILPQTCHISNKKIYIDGVIVKLRNYVTE